MKKKSPYVIIVLFNLLVWLTSVPAAENNSIIFEDNFSDNINKWYIKNNSDVFTAIQDGKYIFEHKRTKGSWYVWQPVTIDTGMDFQIETTIRKINGVENRGFGLVWGMKDTNNSYYFLISGTGYYKYSKQIDNKWIDIIKWTYSDHITQKNSTNILSVRKIGNKIKFFINGYFVNENKFEHFLGHNIGFTIDNHIRIEIDNIRISYLPQSSGLDEFSNFIIENIALFIVTAVIIVFCFIVAVYVIFLKLKKQRIAVQHRTNQALERQILKLAQKYQGRLTISQIALDTELTMAEAEAFMRKLATQGISDIEVSVDDNGVIIYQFPGLLGNEKNRSV